MVSPFWAGAQDHWIAVDVEALRLALGGWGRADFCTPELLTSVGVAWPDALAWLATPARQTLGLAITLADPRYPAVLRRTRQPPPVLMVEGDPAALALPGVAIVGTRACTRYGRSIARELARQLAEAGTAVISGLARGIDAEAHAGALSNGRTVAVLGHGLGHTAPLSHVGLRREIVAGGGAVLSVWPDAFEPRPHTFPLRNAWIAGLSFASVIVEAPIRSGALITARLAAAEGRDVYAVPGPVGAEASAGCLRLIDEGANIVCDLASLVRQLTGASRPPVHDLVELLAGGATLDDAARRLGRPVTEILVEITGHELQGSLVRAGVGRWARGDAAGLFGR